MRTHLGVIIQPPTDMEEEGTMERKGDLMVEINGEEKSGGWRGPWSRAFPSWASVSRTVKWG